MTAFTSGRPVSTPGPARRRLDEVNLHVTTATVGDREVVSVEGVLDLASIGTLHDALSRAAHEHRGRTLVVDLDGVRAIDDSGLGVLLGAAANARESGGDLELVVGDGPIRRRLEQTRLDRAVALRTTIA